LHATLFFDIIYTHRYGGGGRVDLSGKDIVCLATFAVVISARIQAATPPQQSNTGSVTTERALVDKYCVTCHGDKLKTGGLSLQSADMTNIPAGAETWEKVIHKVSLGAMPPQGMPRPDQASLEGLVSWLTTSIDRAAVTNPNPGRATLHRLNRTEYANAIHDVLALDVDPAPLLPADDESYGFDDIADVLRTSPSLLERYMSASWNLSRLAVGDPGIGADTQTYRAKPDLSQNGHMEGLPLGTRGGLTIHHYFPLDGEYVIRVRLWRATADAIKGLEELHQVEISVDGNRVKLATIGGKDEAELSYTNSGKSALEIDARLTVHVPMKAGPRTVVATFMAEGESQDDNILQPFERANLDPLDFRGLPAVDRVSITGPLNSTGPGDTPSRKLIFVCRPTSHLDELPCAKKIISTLARRAYRRPVSDNDLETLLSFYQKGRNEGGTFDAGIEAAIQLILASPEFLFRFEPDPPAVAAGAVYHISDMELASRLSFFLWSTGPDEQLLNLATLGKLKDPTVLDSQVKRMLADPKSKALVDNFADQWLYLRNLKNINPDFETFPDFDDNLRQAMKHETDLFISDIIRQDHSLLDLLNANYTFINERLARHYGIPNVYGTDFRRVTLTDERRRGLLGQASILTLTSYATRTSPVQRGKWILTNLIGMPPPAPPPNVPALKAHADAGKVTSLRERMEEHRKNPACSGCHKIMDPIGFSLENFDAVGQWRTADEGAPIDPAGVMFNGAKVDGAASLREVLNAKPDIFASVFTEKLAIYALGRGLQYYDMPTVRAIVRDAARNDYRFSSIVLGIVKSTPFQMKVKSTEGENRTVTASVRQ
jgi:mono/diheme cytochrome c family protein